MQNNPILKIILSPLERLNTLGEQSHWLTYFIPILIAIMVVAVQIHQKNRKSATRLKALLRMVFPKRIFLHKSTGLDIKLYFVSAFYLSLQTFILGSVFITMTQAITDGLTEFWGPFPKNETLVTTLLLAGPIFILLLVELGYWLGHYAMHKIDFLWAFHKVHHSAPVMTPLTEWRQHPVEFFLIPVSIGCFSSLGMGILNFLNSEAFTFAGLWAPGFILFLFMISLLHLKHSHLRLNFPPWLGTLIQSPMQHQVHHSTHTDHYDRNFGFCLSVWDYIFGTLTHPNQDQIFDFGVRDGEGQPDPLMQSDRVIDHLWLPLVESGKILNQKRKSLFNHMATKRNRVSEASKA
jgi:sterol desaturase/sphingolipid hydroxylase (fatty acid hydroxylase superfamily)